MDTLTVVLVVIGILGITAAVLLLRSNGRASNSKNIASTAKPRSSEKPPSLLKNRYRATAIICGENCCAAVRAIEGKRFLVVDKDVPQIPVPNCDVKKCSCVYAHYEDRREEEDDRRGPRGLRTDLHSYELGTDRRDKRGRRKSDWE